MNVIHLRFDELNKNDKRHIFFSLSQCSTIDFRTFPGVCSAFDILGHCVSVSAILCSVPT